MARGRPGRPSRPARWRARCRPTPRLGRSAPPARPEQAWPAARTPTRRATLPLGSRRGAVRRCPSPYATRRRGRRGWVPSRPGTHPSRRSPRAVACLPARVGNTNGCPECRLSTAAHSSSRKVMTAMVLLLPSGPRRAGPGTAMTAQGMSPETPVCQLPLGTIAIGRTRSHPNTHRSNLQYSVA